MLSWFICCLYPHFFFLLLRKEMLIPFTLLCWAGSCMFKTQPAHYKRHPSNIHGLVRTNSWSFMLLNTPIYSNFLETGFLIWQLPVAESFKLVMLSFFFAFLVWILNFGISGSVLATERSQSLPLFSLGKCQRGGHVVHFEYGRPLKMHCQLQRNTTIIKLKIHLLLFEYLIDN